MSEERRRKRIEKGRVGIGKNCEGRRKRKRDEGTFVMQEGRSQKK